MIGWFARKRILALREFSVEGFKINGRQAQATPETQRSTANFLLVHYGFFHAGYLVFMLSGPTVVTPLDALLIAGAGLGFWFGHQRSHRLNVDADSRGRRNIGALMFLPYARVVPMHAIIATGAATAGGGGIAVFFFALLKTGADVLMYVVEHRWLQGGRRAPPEA